MQSDPILIAGAGPTGLVLALSLARHGVPVRIIDAHSGPGQASRAMVVHARTLEFYRQFGFADEVVGEGIKAERAHLREGGKEVASFSFGDIGAGLSPFPFALCYPQDDHERLLGRKLGEAGVEIEWNTALTGFQQDENGVEATLRTNGTEARVHTPYLCGCDGSHSRVREVLGVGFPGGTYDHLFYVADVDADDAGRDLFINLDKEGFGLKLPVRSRGMQRLIGLVPDALAERTDLQFAEIQEWVERLIGVQVRAVNWFATYHSGHRVAGHFRVRRCFLAGDAGHIHSPAGAQGMNTGIGDAVNLAWKLAAVVQGRAAPAILDTYESERIPFAQQLVATTDRAFQRIVGQGVMDGLLRTWLVPSLLPFLFGFSATRRLLFRTVSQTRIAYHGSALSEGHAGDVRGGDRLPWVAPADNFAPLRALDWQVHVYGAPGAGLREAAAGLGFAVHGFEWSKEAGEAGLKQDAAYLVRPDGYVGLAMPEQDPAVLRRYAAKLSVSAGGTG